MCLTLFGMMGINWVMEFVSWAAGGPDYIWYVTDVINTLQGVIIFCIFVLEPRVRECVKKNWGHKFSEILCRRWTPSSHASVNYSTPEDAAVKTGIL
jgi:G protein-coupled receptor Mth (Methuselah protein)